MYQNGLLSQDVTLQQVEVKILKTNCSTTSGREIYLVITQPA